MAAQHKNSSAALHATTSLGREELAQLAQKAAGEAHGNAWNSPGSVRFERATPNRLDFSVQAPGPLRRELMTFSLAINDRDASGAHDVGVAIARFKTMQNKMWGLIPLGPRKLLGFAAYRSFLTAFGSAVQAHDASASVDVTGIA